MPHDREGKPYEVLLNPLGVISRGNPSQVVEAALGKVAKHRGVPYKVEDFRGQDMLEYAIQEMAKHGLSDLEDIYDPLSGRKIPNVFTGYRHMLKLEHTSASKAQGRGTGAGYTSDELPAKGHDAGSKRLALMDVSAILSHGAHSLLQESQIRGHKNLDWWAAFLAGKTPPPPKVPYTHRKFYEFLRASGINPVPQGDKTQIMALTGRDVDMLAGDRELKNAETVHWDKGLLPVKGGLFGPEETGGHGGNRWSRISLAEPMISPVMEEPVRRLLKLTKKGFEDVLTGREPLQPRGETGPQAFVNALNDIDVDRDLAVARQDFRAGSKSKREEAARRISYLKSAQELKIHPRDWIWHSAPVLPPLFRPVSVMQQTGTPMVGDLNYLYKELFDANRNLKDLKGQTADVGAERLTLYNALKAVAGLGEPITPKNQERGVRGLLEHIMGPTGKFSMVQRKLLSGPVDVVGRAVVTPDPELHLDQVGLPEDKAWDVYAPFTIRRLARRGLDPVRAAELVRNRDPQARHALLEEMGERPVVVTRAPTLHRYNVMAFFPKLHPGHTLRVNPLVNKGFAMDYDGDQSNFHVPTTDKAVQDALDKMLPSRNLFNVRSFDVHQLPLNEFAQGLYHASTAVDEKKPARVYRTRTDALQAIRRHELSSDQRITILS